MPLHKVTEEAVEAARETVYRSCAFSDDQENVLLGIIDAMALAFERELEWFKERNEDE